MHYTDADERNKMPLRKMPTHTSLQEYHLATRYGITFDDPNIDTLAEKFAEDIRSRFFEDPDEAMDDYFMDLTAEIVPAHLYDLEEMDTLEEVKDLLQKMVYAKLQVLITKVFTTGDWK